MEKIVILAHQIKEESEREMTPDEQDKMRVMAMELFCLLRGPEGAA